MRVDVWASVWSFHPESFPVTPPTALASRVCSTGVPELKPAYMQLFHDRATLPPGRQKAAVNDSREKSIGSPSPSVPREGNTRKRKTLAKQNIHL